MKRLFINLVLLLSTKPAWLPYNFKLHWILMSFHHCQLRRLITWQTGFCLKSIPYTEYLFLCIPYPSRLYTIRQCCFDICGSVQINLALWHQIVSIVLHTLHAFSHFSTGYESQQYKTKLCNMQLPVSRQLNIHMHNHQLANISKYMSKLLYYMRRIQRRVYVLKLQLR